MPSDQQLKTLFVTLDAQHFGGRLYAAGWCCRYAELQSGVFGVASDAEKQISICVHEDAAELRRTLLHEMIHAWLFISGDPSHQARNASHGAAFAAELARLASAGEDIASELKYANCANTSPDLMQTAVAIYFARQSRQEEPRGVYRNGHWYPHEEERRACCAEIRLPSRKWPFSLRDHCRTVTHMSQLFGVDTVALRAAIQAARREEADGT